MEMQSWPADFTLDCDTQFAARGIEKIDRIEDCETVYLFEEVPHFVSHMLESLYENIYCTLERLSLYGCLENVYTYVSLSHGKPTCLLLFRVAGHDINVLNQQIPLETEQIKRFCASVFERYKTCRQVDFYALNTSIGPGRLPFIHQEVPQIEENIAVLPQTTEQYLQAMSAQSRNRMLKSIRKIKSDHPSYEFVMLEREQINMRHLRELASLAAKRMSAKGNKPYLDEDDLPALVQFAQTHGTLGLILIEGQIVAGTLSYRVGKRWFSRLIAHEPALNVYGLGNQLQLQVVLAAIEQGAQEFWMMGGGCTDKARFLTRRTMLNSITVYRSRSAALRSWRRFAANDIRRRIFGLKESAKATSLENSFRGRSVASMLTAMRAVKSAGRLTKYLAKLGPAGSARAG